MFVGLDVFRAFAYNPQALHIVEPFGDRRQSGVRVVAQLLHVVCQSPPVYSSLTFRWRNPVHTCRPDPEEVGC